MKICFDHSLSSLSLLKARIWMKIELTLLVFLCDICIIGVFPSFKGACNWRPFDAWNMGAFGDRGSFGDPLTRAPSEPPSPASGKITSASPRDASVKHNRRFNQWPYFLPPVEASPIFGWAEAIRNYRSNITSLLKLQDLWLVISMFLPCSLHIPSTFSAQ